MTPKKERAFLLSIRADRATPAEAAESLEELKGLCDTLGLEIAGDAAAKLRAPSPRYLLGDGKAAEIVAAAKDAEAGHIVVDGILSPSQQRNWEELSGLSVFDRQELIIRIFASRARTREAVLQTELASLQYSLPRLSHSRQGLSRQRGGSFGNKGSGEQALELDKRETRAKIRKVKEELETVRTERSTLRKRRERESVPSCAIVGYTNAGKSSLLNAMTNADVIAENKLFATLDPVTRRLSVGAGTEFLMTDTVGFIKDLPHGLIEAFKATLEEAVDADFLVHVVDGSDRNVDLRLKTTLSVLSELGAEGKPSLPVFTKADLYPELERRQELLGIAPDAIFVSAKTREGLDELAARLRSAAAGLASVASQDEKK